MSYIATKISKHFGNICKLTHFTPFRLYLISLSHLFSRTYHIAWLPGVRLPNLTWKKVLVLKKRVLRLMHLANFCSHAVPYLVSSKVLSINLLYYKVASLLILDVHINNSVPSTLLERFTRTHQMHNYNTRRSSTAGNYYINYSRTNQYKNSFARIGAKIWNYVPENLKNLPKHVVKKEITKLLLQKLKDQVSYVDVEKRINIL